MIVPGGLVRASGRTKQLDIATFDVKHPIILDAHRTFMRLLFEHTHTQHCHQGFDYFRSFVYQRFAVVKRRTYLRTIVTRCVFCRKRWVETRTPIMSDLPLLLCKALALTTSGLSMFRSNILMKHVEGLLVLVWPPELFTLKRYTVWTWAVESRIVGIEDVCAPRGPSSVRWSNSVTCGKRFLLDIRNWNNLVLGETPLAKEKSRWFIHRVVLITDVFGGGLCERCFRRHFSSFLISFTRKLSTKNSYSLFTANAAEEISEILSWFDKVDWIICELRAYSKQGILEKRMTQLNTMVNQK